MFRKLANILITVLLLTTTTGFGISKHYCNANLESVSILKHSDRCCDEHVDCCQTETSVLKLDNYFPGTVNTQVIDQLILQVVKEIDYAANETIQLNPFTGVTNIPAKIPRIQAVLSSLQSYLL